MDRNPDAPWNPARIVEITPTEFEGQVLAWLEKTYPEGNRLLKAEHSANVKGRGGTYQIDVLVHLTILGGAKIVVLVECKHTRRPVERSAVLELESKLRDTSAHKGMLFSTSGFQKGALEYATARGIATVSVVDGKCLFETKSAGPERIEPPPWAHHDPYVGVRLTATANSILCHTIEMERVDALIDWRSEEQASN